MKWVDELEKYWWSSRKLYANMKKMLIHKCGETCNEDEIKLLEGWEDGKGCEMDGREKEMRPKYCRAGKEPLGPSDTGFLFLKQDQMAPPVLFLYSLYTFCVVFLYSSLLILRIFLLQFRNAAIVLIPHGYKGKLLCSSFLLPQFSLLLC